MNYKINFDILKIFITFTTVLRVELMKSKHSAQTVYFSYIPNRK